MTPKFLGLWAVALALPLSTPATADDAAVRGRVVFVQKGCYGCHGYNGQGAITGPKLAPDPIPLDAMTSFVRNAGPTAMPAYSDHVLSNADLSAIHAWLSSQPKPKDPKNISQLLH